jgi:hypothetical protein
MSLITEKTFKDIGFLPLPDGSWIYIEVMSDEDAYVVIASRLIENRNMKPLRGWKITGFTFSEYIEDDEDLKDLMNL